MVAQVCDAGLVCVSPIFRSILPKTADYCSDGLAISLPGTLNIFNDSPTQKPIHSTNMLRWSKLCRNAANVYAEFRVSRKVLELTDGAPTTLLFEDVKSSCSVR